MSLNRYQHTPVLATPLVYVSGQVIALRPAGGIYPHNLDAGGRLRLDWLGGVTATVAADPWRAGVDVGRIDLARLDIPPVFGAIRDAGGVSVEERGALGAIVEENSDGPGYVGEAQPDKTSF